MIGEQKYRYTACGLDDIYLLNGFRVKGNGQRGPIVLIDHLEDLHRAIGEDLIRQKRSLNGKELKFLRHELGLSQVALASLLGESEQSVARREKNKKRPKITNTQERVIRYLYEEHIGGNEKLTQFLKDLVAVDEGNDDEPWTFGKQGWHRKVA